MFELSLHILDIVQNSIAAGAGWVRIEIERDRKSDTLLIRITDDGHGMDEATLKRVRSPFGTTRTTRKVGLGIPMFTACAQDTGGDVSIASEPGKGTTVTAVFGFSHIDRPPMGDIGETFASLILCNPERDFSLTIAERGIAAEDAPAPFSMDTRDLRSVLGEVPLNRPEVIEWIREALHDGCAAWSL